MRGLKTAGIFILALGLIGFFGCKGGKYADAKDVLSQSIKVMQAFVDDVDKANDSQGIVKAINAFAGDMKALKPKLQDLEKKYPELKDETKTPEELKPLRTEMENLSGKLMGAMMKVSQYAQDPDVQKAMEAMNKLMTE